VEIMTAALSRTYEILRKEFEDKEFTRQEAVDLLVKEDPKYNKIYVDKITHELEKNGALLKDWGVSALDQRKSIYRLIDPEDFKKAYVLYRKFHDATIRETSLQGIIDELWSLIIHHLKDKVDSTLLPSQLTNIIDSVISGEASRSRDLQVVKKIDVSALSDDEADNIKEILKLFDASGNYYRSITNVYLEFKEMAKRIERGEFQLTVSEFLTVDGIPLKTREEITNRDLCPVCLKFPQSFQAQALITGQPKTDSRYQLYMGARSQMKVCSWCYMAGYVDLPLSTIRKEGQAITKLKEYIYINSPLTREDIKAIIDRSKGVALAEKARDEELAGKEDTFISELTDGEKRRFRDFAVLGTRKGLVRMEAFILPFQFDFCTTVGVNFPPDQLIALGEKVSGFVKEKLIAATLYDIYELTKGEVQYGYVGQGNLSIFGKIIDVDEARKANQIYEVCNKNRVDFRFDARIFEMFFFEPNGAINAIFRAFFKKEDIFRPGAEKVKEVIDMVDPLANKEDWIFNWGLKLVEFLVERRLIWGASSFHKPQNLGGGTWSSVDLTKWIQNFKMVRDKDSAREWGKRILNALNAGNTVDKEKRPPNKEIVDKLMNLIEEFVSNAERGKMPFSNLSRKVADMDLFLLFYYTHKIKRPREEEVLPGDKFIND